MITKTETDFNEASDSLTGFEELAIEKRFGMDPSALQIGNPVRFVRAIAFTLIARDLKAQDVKDPEGKAYQHVMGMTITEVNDFFPDNGDDDGDGTSKSATHDEDAPESVDEQ